MRQIILSFVLVLFTASTTCSNKEKRHPAEAPKKREWHSVEVLKHDALTIRIKIMKRATIADENWLRIEFENKRETPFNVKYARCRIEQESLNLKSKKPSGSGGLFSGNTFDLFPHAWNTTPVSDRLVKKGIYRVSQQVSDTAARCLGLAPRDGLLVKARLHMDIEFDNGERIETPHIKGIPFEFEWHYPDKAGFEAMKKRLKHILEYPIRWQHSDILYPLLEIPEVANSVTVDELLKAVEIRESGASRQRLMGYLNENYSKDKKVIEFFLKHLKSRDWFMVFDLHSYGPNIWHKDYVQPLLKIYEKPRAGYVNTSALLLLYKHHYDWKEDKRIPGRLSSTLLKQHDLLKKKPEQLTKDRITYWALWARDLGYTFDPNAIKYLVPYLDYKAELYERLLFGLREGERIPPLRTCDVAMEAILRILDEDIEKAYEEAGYDYDKVMSKYFKNRKECCDDMNKIRDRMIEGLKRRLKKD